MSAATIELLLALGEKAAAIVRAEQAGTVTPDEAQAALKSATTGLDGLHATLAARNAKALADLDARFPNG